MTVKMLFSPAPFPGVAFLLLLGIMLFGALVIVLSLRNAAYKQLGIGCFAVLILGGLALGWGDGFGAGVWIMLLTGIIGLALINLDKFRHG